MPFALVIQVMIQILKDMGITEYEPRVINQMLEFTYSGYLSNNNPYSVFYLYVQF